MSILLGKLTLDSLPHEWFTIGGSLAMTMGGIGVAAALAYFKKWGWLWREWLTSTDPKKIGIMYIIVAALMLVRGALDAGMIWLQQSLSVGASQGYLSPEHFQQIFTAHGAIMIFFVTTGFLFGIINFIVPLQIGARDVAFPLLNTLSFWLYAAGAILMNLFFVFGGDFAATGWLAVPPLSELAYSPGVGVDYWLWSLQISGLGSLLSGVNILVTILKMRAPGMTLMRMPMFTWATLCSMILVLSAFPVLTIALLLLSLDRSLGMHFFTTNLGGNAMLYVNLIWSWGHPEVYILMLPAFGIYSEIVSVFSKKKLFGYTAVVIAALTVTALSGLVWLHHFFTMGGGADVNAFFGIMTGFIGIPTGVLVFNWLATMYKGKIIFHTSMLWFMGFVCTFTLGGIAGVILGMPGLDFQLHNSLFLVAHFHTMVIGGALFGIFAGIAFWWPKVTGFKLNERLGRYAFWLWLIGFMVSFIPLYILGLMGATRRLDHYDASTGWQPFFITSAVGMVIIGAGAVMQVVQIIVSIKQRKQNLDTSGDPWDGHTLEWATKSPPPVYNFAIIPEVKERDAWWILKNEEIARSQTTKQSRSNELFAKNQTTKPSISYSEQSQPNERLPRPNMIVAKQSISENGLPRPAILNRKNVGTRNGTNYPDIHMPKNTGMGIYISAFAFLMGFGFIWHIVWLILFGLAGAIACVIVRSFDEETENTISAKEVERMEKENIGYL